MHQLLQVVGKTSCDILGTMKSGAQNATWKDGNRILLQHNKDRCVWAELGLSPGLNGLRESLPASFTIRESICCSFD